MTPAYTYSIDNVVRRFGDAFALRVPRMEIEAGKAFCLVGPTGAGKSTLLRLLSGLEHPAEGHISLNGTMFNGRTPIEIQRQIAYVPQKPILLHGSLRYNVEVGLRLRRVRVAATVDEILGRLQLQDLASQAAATLSGGQAQLTAIARAIVVRPQVLLLDEPTAHLDPGRVALVEALIAANRREYGTTVVWATHNLFQARRMADRVGFLLNGQLVETLPTRDFFERPVDPRTASFVQGTMVY